MQVIKTEDADYELQDQNIRGVTNTVVDVEHEEAGYMAHFFNEVNFQFSFHVFDVKWVDTYLDTIEKSA